MASATSMPTTSRAGGSIRNTCRRTWTITDPPSAASKPRFKRAWKQSASGRSRRPPPLSRDSAGSEFYGLIASTGKNACATRPQPSLQEFDAEDQRGIRGDVPAGAALAVCQFRRNLQQPHPARLHSRNPFLPSLDDLVQPERDRLVALDAAVENGGLLVGEPARVVHLDLGALLDGLALADLLVPNLEAGFLLLPLLGIEIGALELVDFLLLVGGRGSTRRGLVHGQ